MNAIYLSDKPDNIVRVYTSETKARIAEEYTVRDGIYQSLDLCENDLRDTEVIFSTWGMPALSNEEISTYFPRLRAIFYAAGSVQAFARPFIERGIRVFSAWQANALPVVEYAVSQILLANKGFYQSTVRMRENGKKAASSFFKHYPGNYNAKVGILGDGAIGAKVIRELLRHRSCARDRRPLPGIHFLPLDPFPPGAASQDRRTPTHLRPFLQPGGREHVPSRPQRSG
jgi:phosphoglycerate dehydrogenase-like enzyme